MRWFLILSMFSGVLACSHGNCRSQRKADAKPEAVTEQKTGAGMTQTATSDRVKVYKPDGSLQCGQGKAIPLAEMQSQLAGIKIHSSLNRNDGMMRVQVCGAPTGNVNMYEIDRKDLPLALKKGFKEWTQGD